ncbi:copper chaperone PCu(A)C [Corynebacterium sp. zg-331]|uniref:copper chaperone PCu(A)C n=1 Tax=unclassified Corynebacterium TaxID=2624378 RepID=UPI00128B07E3|nr:MULTISPECIES: copper chaperone PCu(A)C [unclassified Corynebacterium]MBC3185434.1 copper chaperone PCu(A)C [Corynebacterium sp. zg-331]MPV51929.1 copper chaperone PCu(A)C [Corynebacterium sp. zg331]
MKAVKLGAGILTLVLGLTAAGCSHSDEQADGDVRLDDAVIKAKGEDNDMTSIFGTLVNDTDKDVTVESFTTSLGEAHYQLHEVVDGVMREKSGGFAIPAHGTHELRPGGDHMMVMGYAHPVAAGDEITVTLNLGDGSETELDPIPVRSIGAGEENYGDLEGSQDGHEHGDHAHKEG